MSGFDFLWLVACVVAAVLIASLCLSSYIPDRSLVNLSASADDSKGGEGDHEPTDFA
ncbi:MAG: hypothetical protein JXA24_04055 [Proteobacteria bacterium]|nr:hypothetical protein [Pseudomonadota bacterium]